MEKEKLVSIVVPVYKSENYLNKLVSSILDQSYENIELILVDDGSPDHSGEICDRYEKKDSRVKVIHKKNGGTCEARNYGIEMAKGYYLMFADGDDWLEPDCVEYLVSLIELNNADMSMTDSIFTTRDRIQNENENIRIVTNKEAVASIINTFLIPVGPWNKLYKLEIVKENNISFSVPWFGEGLYFSTMLAQYSNTVAIGHRKVYNYRLNNPNSGCTLKEVKNAINSLNNIEFIKQSLKITSTDIQSAIDWHLWQNYFNLVYYIIGSENKKAYKNELNDAKLKMKHLILKAFRNRYLSTGDKVKMIIITCFPSLMANYSLKKSNQKLKEDLKTNL